MNELVCISPVDGREYLRRAVASDTDVAQTFTQARRAQKPWKALSFSERAALCTRFVDAFVADKAAIAEELTWQIGRPIRYTPNEVDGFAARARHMISIAEESLADVVPPPLPGFTRFLRREPLGIVFVIAPWNYPLLTAVNSIVPALMAGNTVVLKHSAQTPRVAERLAAAARAAGLPDGVFAALHLSHAQTRRVLEQGDLNAVFFTGSVAGGVEVEDAVRGRFLHVGLELGGCDPAYVRPDADLAQAVDSLVDGAMFHSGQSCCGIQRIYVHTSVYDEFCERAAALLRTYVLADPRLPETTLGPVVRVSAAEQLRRVADAALAGGARDLVAPSHFGGDRPGTGYVAPRLLADARAEMELMREECFAPIAGIEPVRSDEEALARMNDSAYGLTAALFTSDPEVALSLGDALDTGTVFMNRCDVLDPALAWVGVKNTGRGCTLSRLGYEHLTRPKSFHFKTAR